MDKLFDLMVMGLKYQLMCSTKLEQMLQVGAVAWPGQGACWLSVVYMLLTCGVRVEPPSSC